MSTLNLVLRKAPRRQITPLGDLVVTRRELNLELGYKRIIERIEISHPHDIQRVAFSREPRA